ncbi:MAG: hypothetical protein WC551_05015 [Patescibacteria group bacterium]
MPRTEDYVDRGYNGIVLLKTDEHESRSGMQEEVTRQRIACRDAKRNYLELVFVWVDHPLKPTSCRIDEQRTITKERYLELAEKAGGVLDTESFYQDRERRRQAAVAAREELERMTPLCPSCGERMQIRVNRRKQTFFWGCPTYKWKGCKGTRDISEAVSRRIHQLNAIINGAR